MKLLTREGDGGVGGKTVVVGVKLDSHSKELLTWALVKVVEPGDNVIAIHVPPPHPLWSSRFSGAGPAVPHRRSFCTVISGALHSGGGAAERTKPEIAESWRPESGNNRVGEFRKKLKVVDIKGGPDEGLERLGQSLLVMGWVRTLRVQSSVTFIEVNDGSCLSNMQCVLGLDAEGYDQVESGLITTGASIWVQGILAASQGSKQKVELKVKKIVVVGKSDPSYPIQKKRVSREFLRTKAHLRPRTNTFGADMLPFALFK